MSKFINLHVHSEFSILDGCGRQTDFIQRAGEMGQEALAFTDHGTLRGAYNFHEKAQGIKPLFGIEFYLTRDHKVRGLPEEEIQTIKTNLDGKGKLIIKKALKARGEELGVRKTNHVTVLAKTNQGLKNLYRLASIGWLEGFYYRPRIDLNLLHQYGDGLIVLSGCLQGMISQLLLEDKIEEALEMAEAFQGRWGEDFYLEMMPNSIPNQAKVNRALVQIAHGLGISLVATIDAHYPRRADWRAHDVLLCVNTKKKLNDPERWRFSVQDFWLHSRKEVLAGFKVNHPSIPRETVLEAIASTEEITGKCEANLEIDTGALFIPDPLDTKNDFQELMSLSWEGWDSRDIPGKAEAQGIDEEVYLDRLKKELSQIRKQKVSKYFLVVWDLCKWVRKQNIACGPGRGSAGGCLVAYLLRITDIDPVAHGLLFERFLSPDRIDIPDIDLDFEDRRRGEIIGYLKEKYGEDCVCQISTVAAMKGRLCLRDIGRALDLPYGEIDQIAASLVIKDEERDKPILEEAFQNIPVCQTFNRKHPEVIQYAKVLECQARHLGLHAAGVLVSSVPLQEIIPLETRNHKGERVVCSGWDMKGCEAAGLLKIDILGLRNLAVNADCLQAIEDNKLEGPIWEDMGLDDKDVLQDFSDGHFIGIFQFDTASAAAMSRGVNFERFEDIVAMVALDRPGTARSGLATQFLERKADPSKRKPFHPIVDKICEDTHGVLVYQEQISKLFIELAGYSPGEADGVRKAVGKKLGLGDHKEKFIKGAVAQGMAQDDAEKLAAQINHFGAYGFNLSHSTAYALTAYRQMWLKRYFPVQFMWALMKNEPDRHQIRRFLGEARRLEVEVTAPLVGSSQADFRISKDNPDVICSGLADLKGLGPAAVESIVESSPFIDFPDFAKRTNTRSVNKRVVEVLAKAGAFKGYILNLRWFLENFEEIWKRRTSKGFQEWWEIQRLRVLPDFTEEEKAILASEVSPFGGGGHPIEPFKVDLDQWRILWSDLGDEIWERPWAWVRGVIVANKYARVGDYHSSGEDLTDEEKERRGWGKQFATLNLEGLEGSKKIKVNWDRMNPDMRTVIDQGVGTPVIALLAINAPYKSLQVRVLWSLKEMWEKVKADKLDLFERSIIHSKGLLRGHKAQDLTRRVLSGGKKRTGVAVVVSVIERIDKNLRPFARIGFWGVSGFLEAVCFSSNWDHIQKRVSEGQLVEVKVESSGMGWVIKDLEVLRSGLMR